MEESIEQCIEDLLTVACCPGHDYSCKKVYKYIKELQQENDDLKGRLENAVANYLKTILYLKNKLNTEVMEYSKQKELMYILNMLEKVE